MHEERFDLLVEEPSREGGGVPYSVVFSVIVHAALIFYLATHVTKVAQQVPAPIVHYVELMRQNPQDKTFTEAPGPKIQNAPRPDASWSDANRKAQSPEATGDKPTTRPGDGSMTYQPPQQPRGDAREQQRAQQAAQEAFAQQPPTNNQQPPAQPNNQQSATNNQLTYHAASAGAVDLRGAIREIGKVATLSGDGDDLKRAVGGEKGYTAEAGPLSFETQWYDWGEYAQSMVSRIRVNWYSIMPELIKTGVKGVVTIRFTIERNGSITDIEILNSSGIPPFDFAAKHALELASPLKPLPADFPKKSERVTAMFYYNMEIPGGSG